MVQTNNILVGFTIDNINKKTNLPIAYRDRDHRRYNDCYVIDANSWLREV